VVKTSGTVTASMEPLPVPAALVTAAGDFLTLPPRHGTDGAFAARLVRRG